MCLFPTSGTSSFKFCSFTLNASRCADKACLLFQRRLWKSIWGKLSPFSWKESPGVSHKPECIQGSSPTREEVVENVYVPVAVTFLASDLFRIWQTGPECGVSAADLCVKCSWKLVNNGYEVEVPTPNLLSHAAVRDADEESVSCSWVPQMSGHCSLHIHSNYIWKRTKTTPQDYFPHCGVTLVAGGETNRTGDAFLNMQRR